MIKMPIRKIDLDLSLRVLPEDIEVEFLNKSSRVSLFDLAKWHTLLTHWLEVICTEDDFLCPAIIFQMEKLSLGIQFTDDSTIYKLNQKWRKKHEATDVLSFPLIDEDSIFPSNEELELGDIVISVATAFRQSQEYQHDLDRELRWLVSHGLLHLLGWDHPDEDSLNKMLKVQERLLDINVNL